MVAMGDRLAHDLPAAGEIAGGTLARRLVRLLAIPAQPLYYPLPSVLPVQPVVVTWVTSS